MTNSSRSYDIIIAGAGCAGLSLAWYITKYTGKKFTILMLDVSFTPINNKTWCFWDDQFLPDPVQVYKSWDHLHFGSEHHQVTELLKDHKYHCVRSGDYSEQLMNDLLKWDNIEWKESVITNITDHLSYAEVFVPGEKIRGEYVFQSIYGKKFEDETSLKQHFLGWEIELKTGKLEESAVTLMDFRTDQKDATAFMYVLPYTRQKALVEYTLFSKNLLSDEEYEQEIKIYLQKNYGFSKDDYQITRIEKGIIPMVQQPSGNGVVGRVFEIGQLAGVSKPTTGYTFNRIHRINELIAKALSEGVEPVVNNRSDARFRFYDLLLLDILVHRAEYSEEIFTSLFRSNKMDRILKFLDEKTTLIEEVGLLKTLPFKPFLQVLGKNRSKIIKMNF